MTVDELFFTMILCCAENNGFENVLIRGGAFNGAAVQIISSGIAAQILYSFEYTWLKNEAPLHKNDAYNDEQMS